MVSEPDVTLRRLTSTTSDLCDGELCQACLTQGQLTQRRSMVMSGIRTLESGR